METVRPRAMEPLGADRRTRPRTVFCRGDTRMAKRPRHHRMALDHLLVCIASGHDVARAVSCGPRVAGRGAVRFLKRFLGIRSGCVGSFGLAGNDATTFAAASNGHAARYGLAGCVVFAGSVVGDAGFAGGIFSKVWMETRIGDLPLGLRVGKSHTLRNILMAKRVDFSALVATGAFGCCRLDRLDDLSRCADSRRSARDVRKLRQRHSSAFFAHTCVDLRANRLPLACGLVDDALLANHKTAP